MGMRLFKDSSGFVRLFPFSLSAALSFFRYRSIVAGLLFASFSAISPVILKAGHRARCTPFAAASAEPVSADFSPTALEPEKRPDRPQTVDDPVSIDTPAASVGGPFFLRLYFDCRAVPVGHNLLYRLCA